MNNHQQTSRIYFAPPLSDRWYYPIVEQLDAFEDSHPVFKWMESPLSDSAPPWVTQCLFKSVEPYREECGLGGSQLNARRIGAHIGAKASVFSAMAMLRERDRQMWVDTFGAEVMDDVSDLRREVTRFVKPSFECLQLDASKLVLRQTTIEQMNFHHGLWQGLQFMTKYTNSIRPGRTKLEKDAQARRSVYRFAVLNWQIIEQRRGSLTWRTLTDEFEQYSKREIQIEELTVKKILQRCGLQGLQPGGRPGAPRRSVTRNR